MLFRSATQKTDEEEMSKWSSELRDRLQGNITQELGEIGMVGEIRKFFTGKTSIKNKLMQGIRKADYQTVGKIWNAVKLETKELHPNLSGDAFFKKVSERTEFITRRTQPTFSMKDRSKLTMSGNVWVKLLTKYTTQRNKNLRAIKRTVSKYNRSEKTTKDKAKFVKNLFLITILSSLMIHGIDELRDLFYGKKKKSFLSHIVSVIGNTLSYVYFLGDAFSSVVSKIERGMFGWDMSNPVSSFLDNALSGVADGYNAIEQLLSGEVYKSGDKRGEKKWKSSAGRFVNAATSTTSKIVGFSYDNLKKLLESSFEIVSGKRKGKNLIIYR